jgi:predicted nucleic acid-binding protein
MLIAATAITHELELYTLNIKDFKFIPELNVYPIT